MLREVLGFRLRPMRFSAETHPSLSVLLEALKPEAAAIPSVVLLRSPNSTNPLWKSEHKYLQGLGRTITTTTTTAAATALLPLVLAYCSCY